MLVFVDADVVLAPHAVAATVALLEQTGLDLLSPYPRQEAPGATRLVQPLLQWSWLTFLPLRLAERSPRPSLSAANGQLLAVRRSGVRPGRRARRRRATRSSRTSRCCGRSSAPAAPAASATAPRWRRRACTTPGASSSTATPSRCGRCRCRPSALLVALYVVPPLAALRGSRAGALGYAAGVAGRVVAARRTGGSSVDALAHPVSVALLAGLAVRSRVARRRGTLTWKGAGAVTRRGRGTPLHASSGAGRVSRVVVIGAGVGGLAAAARLADAGPRRHRLRGRATTSAASSGWSPPTCRGWASSASTPARRS